MNARSVRRRKGAVARVASGRVIAVSGTDGPPISREWAGRPLPKVVAGTRYVAAP